MTITPEALAKLIQVGLRAQTSLRAAAAMLKPVTNNETAAVLDRDADALLAAIRACQAEMAPTSTS